MFDSYTDKYTKMFRIMQYIFSLFLNKKIQVLSGLDFKEWKKLNQDE